VQCVGVQQKNKAGIKYPHLSSAIKPMPHGPDDLIPAALAQVEDIETSSSSESMANDDVDFSPDNEDTTPQLFTQIELDDLVRDLGLATEKSKILGSRLKENLSAPGTTFYWFRNREKEFRIFFRMEGQLVLCCDISALIH
jgi:hypothetical protein